MKKANFIYSLILLFFSLLVYISCDELGGFEVPSYTVIYLSNGGDGTMESSTHVYGTARNLNINTFTRGGHVFGGWSDSAAGQIIYYDQQSVKNLTKEAGASITLYAQWNGNSYTVVYDANGGTGTMEDSYFIYGVSENLRPNAFTNTGYNFAGWALSEDGLIEFENEESVANISSIAGEIITLYAQWAGYSYTIVYNANSGIGNMPNSDFNYGISKNLSANTFNRSGYVFIGWALTEDGSVEFEDGALVRNLTMLEGGTVTLFAQWLPSYSIFFIANDGIPSPQSPINVPQGSKVAEPPPMIKTGYIFDGWYKESGFSNKWNFIVDIPTSDATLYAQWLPITYSVIYDKNASDATGATSSSSHIYDIEQYLTANGFARDGYKFSGWSTSATGSLSYTNEQSVKNLSANNGEIITLYAVWEIYRTPGLYRGNEKIGNHNLNASLSFLSTNAVNGANYFIVLGADESIDPAILNYGKTIGITLIGYDSERTITLNANGYIFDIGSNVTFTLDENITLFGRVSNTNRFIRVNNNAAMIMNNGAKITRNYGSTGAGAGGGGVYVTDNGSFIMNGGEISDNRANASDGAGVWNGGSFTMYGGKISGNSGVANGGGGVHNTGSFTMYGGTISGNTTNSNGGGVFTTGYGATFSMYGGIISGNTGSHGGGVGVGSGGLFIKAPYGSIQNSGIIYGNDETGFDENDVPLRNTATAASGNDHAVYVSLYSTYRNTTAGITDQIDSATGRGLSSNGNPPFGQ